MSRTPPESPATKLLLDAMRERRIADFGALPDAQRRLDARALQAILDGETGEPSDAGAPLRILGARIEGALHPFRGTRSADGRAILRFIGCQFDSPVDFSAVEFVSLGFLDCDLPAFIGKNLGTRTDLDFSGCSFTGVGSHETEIGEVAACSIHLGNARIGGHLRLGATGHRRFIARGTLRMDGAMVSGDVLLPGALLDGEGAESLSARATSVGGNVELIMADDGSRFEALGEVCLVAATIAGDLSLESARLHNPQGRALHCEDLKVESVSLTATSQADPPFESSGRINFLTSTIGGSFFFTNSRVDPGPDYRGLLAKGGPVLINLRQSRISNALVLNNIGALDADPANASHRSDPRPVRGWYMLSGVQVNTIADGFGTGWPSRGFLELDGAQYARIQHFGGSDIVATRLRWLLLQFPETGVDAASFRPQPYEHLASVLRSQGLSKEADAVAVEKIRVRLSSRVDRGHARLFTWILMLVSHYGYSTRRAVAAFVLFVMLGAALYATAIWGFDQTFVPVQEPPELADYTLFFESSRKKVERGCPGLDVLHYALDVALPFIDLGQDTHCRFEPDGPARPLWLLLHGLYVIVGNTLSALVVLTLSGVMRKG